MIWPPHSPIYTYGAVFIAVVLTGFFHLLPVHLRQRAPYNVSIRRPTSDRALQAQSRPSRRNNYRMLMLGARGIPPRLATNADVTDGTTPEPGGKPIPLALSRSALQSGYVLLYLGPEQNYNDASLSAYLKSAVYGGDSLFDIYKLPLLFRSGITHHPAPIFYRQGRATAATTEIRTTPERPRDDDAERVQQQGRWKWHRHQD